MVLGFSGFDDFANSYTDIASPISLGNAPDYVSQYRTINSYSAFQSIPAVPWRFNLKQVNFPSPYCQFSGGSGCSVWTAPVDNGFLSYLGWIFTG